MGRFSKGGVGLYTRTADEDFIIDHHPEYPHVSIRIFRALLQVQQCGGEILSETSTAGNTKHDISIFSLALPGLRKGMMYNQ
ncbi:hypothetical protein ACG2QI_16940 [Bacillus sp. GM2]|uniref:hypothetical protein n=1 Tax=Bacillus TaxID=1386 RepID=UPI00039FA6FD|nr:hypothetical protein [Bacillus paralicheniformis]MSO00379.1 hypothetical protein [Bacillus paralicheniformis]MSO04387.1 hypothetical protein [Bacillus paralicheniformis]MSO08380.1 hypothetical protein [Bacillus paralicheniformis]MSO12374.1 hypothetical protein [Bacillus paralicheniformis]NJE38186.1 hypothetical protein [Bacillus paralicheniformis]